MYIDIWKYATHLSESLSPKICGELILFLPERFLQVFSWITPQFLFSEFVSDDK